MMPRPAVIHCTSPAPSAPVAQAVAMLDGAGEHVGDGLDAAVRMPGEPLEVVLGPVVAEVVEEQERIEVLGVAEAESAAQADAGALHGRGGAREVLDGADGHEGLPEKAAWDATRRRRPLIPGAGPRAAGGWVSRGIPRQGSF